MIRLNVDFSLRNFRASYFLLENQAPFYPALLQGNLKFILNLKLYFFETGFRFSKLFPYFGKILRLLNPPTTPFAAKLVERCRIILLFVATYREGFTF